MNRIKWGFLGTALLAGLLYILHNNGMFISISHQKNHEAEQIDNEDRKEAAIDSFSVGKLLKKYTSSAFLEVQKQLREFRKERRSKLPKRMADVEITPEIKKRLEGSPGEYERLDYKLQLLDRFAQCLGSDEPESGSFYALLKFQIDRDAKVATGGGEEPVVEIRRSELRDDTEKELMASCLYEAHMGFSYDAEGTLQVMSLEPDEKIFKHPIAITFPLEDDEFYIFIMSGK